MDRREGIDWQELWAPQTALESWGGRLAGKLVLARMDSSTAVAYANYGAGRVARLTLLARSIKELEVPLGCTAVALHIAGRRNAAAEALSRFTIRARGLDPYPRGGPRPKFRQEVIERCGVIDFDMLVRDDGPKPWWPQFRPPSNSAFARPLPPGQLLRSPRINMNGRVLTRAASSLEDWSGPHLRLCPLESRRPWCPMLAFFERIISRPSRLSLILNRINGFSEVIRDEKKMARAVFRLQSRANKGIFLRQSSKG